MKQGIIYKIFRDTEWRTAVRGAGYRGSADDLRDGFIHFSTRQQIAETARRYFSSETLLHIAAFKSSLFPPENLRWEASRGGDLFPHLYDIPLDVTRAAAHIQMSHRPDDDFDFSFLDRELG